MPPTLTAFFWIFFRALEFISTDTSALNAPPTVEHIAGLANGPEEASEIYGAALTAIDLDSPSEHLFLRRLASSLKLDEQLVKTVHETLERE
jgi:uncharacterized membrane protein YebE (DUF533 family)